MYHRWVRKCGPRRKKVRGRKIGSRRKGKINMNKKKQGIWKKKKVRKETQVKVVLFRKRLP